MPRRLIAGTVALVIATAAIAQESPSIEVGSLITGPGANDLPSSTVIVDLHHTVRGLLDFWTAGGVSAATFSGAKFLYSTDPNTGNLLTHPDADGGDLTVAEKYATFVSKPRGQFNNPRFRGGGAASIVGGYIPNSATARASDFDVNVAWADIPPSGFEGSGWVTRLAIDISGVYDLSSAGARNRKSYVQAANVAPLRPGDQLICTISAAVATSEFTNPLVTSAFKVWLDRPPAKGLRAGGG